MKKYRCLMCGHIYDEEKEGTKFSDLPESWTCPMCGVPKAMFQEMEEDTSDDKKAEAAEASSHRICASRCSRSSCGRQHHRKLSQ